MSSSEEKAKAIRLAIFDVDGVLSNGLLKYGTNGTEIKSFHVHDGLGMKLLQKYGVEVAIITARKSDAVTQRMQDLKISHVYQNASDKVLAYEELKKLLKVSDNEIAYMGDDLPDLPLLRRAGLAVTVPNAPAIIKQHANIVTKAKGGKGAVREFCEFILNAQGNYENAIQEYLQR